MRRRLVLLCLCLLLAPAVLGAQTTGGDNPTWAFHTRAIMTGVSDASEPEGYKVYSAFSMEAGLTRLLGHNLALGWTFGTESREVELTGDQGDKVNLGSIEVLPVTMLLQFRPHLGGRFHPYVGGGAQFTVFWEKSGALDSTDLTPEIGPVLQAGFDLDISTRMVFNVEFRAARLETDLEADGQKIATISLHPSTLGVGIGFRF
jgi:outer membrane protein